MGRNKIILDADYYSDKINQLISRYFTLRETIIQEYENYKQNNDEYFIGKVYIHLENCSSKDCLLCPHSFAYYKIGDKQKKESKIVYIGKHLRKDVLLKKKVSTKVYGKLAFYDKLFRNLFKERDLIVKQLQEIYKVFNL